MDRFEYRKTFGRPSMTESWIQYEGQIVDDKFTLRRYLGGSNHSIVFLTHSSDSSSQDAAIKLIPASSIDPDLQLSQWRAAQQFSHTHLLPLFDIGRCQFDGRDWLYVVTEYAEENLAQILPERPLTQEEIRDALNPMLEAIQYLHSRNFIHGRIKPSNILVVGNQIKLSTDSVLGAGKTSGQLPFPSAYDAPECVSGVILPQSDNWSLGMLIVEALTQKSPVLGVEPQIEPDISDAPSNPLLDISRHTLVQNPEQRWSVADIVMHLNPKSKTDVKTTPLNVSAPAAANVPNRADRSARMTEQFSQLPPIPHKKNQASSKRSYFLPAAIVVVILIAVLVISNFANRKGRSSSGEFVAVAPTVMIPQSAAPAHSSPTQSSASRLQSKSSEKPASVQTQQQPISQDSLKNASEKSKIPPAETASPSMATRPKSSSTKGDVLEQVLPEVSEKARNSIRGTVRVNVRVHVSPAGSVTQSELDSESSSKYFSDLSVQAARRWTFQSAEVDGRSSPSEWVIRFEFTPTDTKAFPQQANP
jgi:TonB family protein